MIFVQTFLRGNTVPNVKELVPEVKVLFLHVKSTGPRVWKYLSPGVEVLVCGITGPWKYNIGSRIESSYLIVLTKVACQIFGGLLL